MEEKKSWYESKSIWMNLFAGMAMILAVFFPPAAEFIKTYFAEAGVGWAILNIALRLVTKKEVM